jgi:hypothetical protein
VFQIVDEHFSQGQGGVSTPSERTQNSSCGLKKFLALDGGAAKFDLSYCMIFAAKLMKNYGASRMQAASDAWQIHADIAI